ncbi:MAG: SRPBCC family protein [Micromonosporaceae bacterium]|nr:SRPBCC family protein [Micromonosporaceae bacterium]
MTARALTVERDVAAPAERTWRVLSDWPGQSEWMLGTQVRLTRGDGRSVGSRLVARTGWGPLAFTDPMEITRWEPPRRCDVRHTGRLVRGVGIFTVVPRGDARSTVVWTERLELPFGVVGRLGWPLARPAFEAGVRLSLRQLAHHCEHAP